jgi:hypothetical protein
MSDTTEERGSGAGVEAIETITLVGRHALLVERSPEKNVLRVLTPEGAPGLVITVTPQGISLTVSGGDLTLETQGALAIRADELSLHGNKGVSITSDGDATVRAAGDLSSEGRVQNIRARLGSVNVTANDDVKLIGERIRLNI